MANEIKQIKVGTEIYDIVDAGAQHSAPGNGTLTIQKNGSNIASFTANSSTNTTANISVPTKTSDLTNDSSFVTTSQLGTQVTYSYSSGTLTITTK